VWGAADALQHTGGTNSEKNEVTDTTLKLAHQSRQKTAQKWQIAIATILDEREEGERVP